MKFGLASFSHLKDVWEYREEPENMRVLGQYLWRALLVLALITALFAVWFGYEQLGVVTAAESGTAAPKSPPAPLDPKALQAELNAFTARQAEYQQIQSSALPQVADPSK